MTIHTDDGHPGTGTVGTSPGPAPLPDLSGAPDAIAMLRHVVAAAQAVTGADGAAILLYNQESGLFVPTTPSVAVGLDERWLQRQGLEAARSLACVPRTAAI